MGFANRKSYFSSHTGFCRIPARRAGENVGLELASIEGEGGGIHVAGIVPGGAAERDGNVRVGDILVEMNGESVLGIEYQEFLKELSSLGSAALELKIASRDSLRIPNSDHATNKSTVDTSSSLTAAPGDNEPVVDASPSPAAASTVIPEDPSLSRVAPSQQLQTIKIERTDLSEKLGISLAGGTSPGSQIVKVQAESPASRAGLKVGDSIVSINGQDTLFMAYADVVEIIRSIKMQADLIILPAVPQLVSPTRQLGYTPYVILNIAQQSSCNPLLYPVRFSLRKVEKAIASHSDPFLFSRRPSKISRGYVGEDLGIELGQIRDELGTRITGIIDGGPCHRVGLKVGDLILSVGGETVLEDVSDLRSTLFAIMHHASVFECACSGFFFGISSISPWAFCCQGPETVMKLIEAESKDIDIVTADATHFSSSKVINRRASTRVVSSAKSYEVDREDRVKPSPRNSPSPSKLPLSTSSLAVRPAVGPDYELISCTICRFPCEGLGLQIKSDKRLSHKGVVVADIVAGSAADRTDALKVGDLLIKVDGHDVDGASHAKIVQILQNAGTEIEIVTRRRVEPVKVSELLAGKLGLKPKLVHITVDKPEGAKLGVEIYSDHGVAGVTVGKVVPGLACALAGVQKRDHFMEINGVDVSSADHSEIVSLLAQTRGKINLIVMRC